MDKLSKLPKQYWIAALVGGAILGLVLRNRAKANQTSTTAQSNAAGTVTDQTATPSPALAQDYAPIFSGTPYPTYPDYPSYPPIDTAVTTDTSLNDTPTLLANIADSQAVATASIIALENAVSSGRSIGKGGGAPKGRVVKSHGHPTHKEHPAHTGTHEVEPNVRKKKPGKPKKTHGGGKA